MTVRWTSCEGALPVLQLRDKPECWKVCSPQGFVFACWRTRFGAAPSAIWADESESDFQAFQSALERLRATDTWRSGDEPNPA